MDATEPSDILKDLMSFQESERFYRAYYYAVKAGSPVDSILQMDGIGDEERLWVTHPEKIDPRKTELDFFKNGRNVQFLKHPRYFPFFSHSHTFFEIVCVLSGRCLEYTGEKEHAKPLELKAGDLFLLAPGVTHGIEVFDDDSIVVNILIRHSTFMDIFLNTIKDKSKLASFFLGNLYEREKLPYLLFRTEENEQIRNYILEMLEEESQQDEYADRIVCAMLTVFFNRLNRRYDCQAYAGDHMKLLTEEQHSLVNYIFQNYRTTTLGEVAQVFHFSVPYCSKLVRSLTGSSFQDLISRVRLSKAENLLSHTQLSVADISDEVGYKNQETFIRAFTRYYQMSPSRYRKSVLVG